jgi:hypothetical protein
MEIVAAFVVFSGDDDCFVSSLRPIEAIVAAISILASHQAGAVLVQYENGIEMRFRIFSYTTIRFKIQNFPNKALSYKHGRVLTL